MDKQLIWQNATTYVVDPYIAPWYFGIATGEDLGSTLAIERLTDQWHQVEHEQLNGARADKLTMSVAEGRSLAAQIFYRSIGSYSNYTGGITPAVLLAKHPQLAMRRLVAQKSKLLSVFRGPCEIDVLELNVSLQCLAKVVDNIDVQDQVDSSVGAAIQNSQVAGLMNAADQECEQELLLFDVAAIRRIASKRRLCLVWNGNQVTRVYAKEPAEEYAVALEG